MIEYQEVKIIYNDSDGWNMSHIRQLGEEGWQISHVGGMATVTGYPARRVLIMRESTELTKEG